MHIVKDKIDSESGYERSLAVCTTTPTRYLKSGVPFLSVNGDPFRELTYIRLDPVYVIKNVKIKSISRTNSVYRLNKDNEAQFFNGINNAEELVLDRNEFITLNSRYSNPV